VILNPEKDLKQEGFLGKFFVGTVRAHDPDPQVGRVRVHVPDLMEGYADEDCPWAGTVRPVFRGTNGAPGFHGVPRIGSRVLVVFDKGDINSPVILGELIDGAGKAGVLGENYPNRYGWEDENGNYLYYDVQTKVFKIKNENATITIQGNSDVEVETTANIKVNAGQNIDVTAGAHVNVTAGTTMALTAQGPISVTSATQVGVSAPAISMGQGPVTISSDTVVNIQAPSVNIN
jgi:uncharacterized protein involved in type VI secretion and phage assembly